MERFLQTNTLSGKLHGRMRKYYYSCTAHFSTKIVPQDKKQARKRPFYRLLRAFENYSNSSRGFYRLLSNACFSYIIGRSISKNITLFISFQKFLVAN